ncbi:hypothetical protein [[Clostridium] dakarense]|uniref:hypothetical protein n=1 Tax=Faecalimicrobium dakarense TaxID=1301100 RepID=UPI0004B8A6B7|nr:hypothetical protein [[Clostridium] dakarense]
MKKVNTDALEKMAKQKNIDKEKIEQIADGYKGKSENELMDELIKIGKNLQGKDEVISKFKTFLDDDQRKKLDTIMGKISEAEVQDKLESKKLKSKKTSSGSKSSKESSSNQNTPTKHKSSKHSSSAQDKSTSESNGHKKVKKVVKKVKKSNHND